MTIFEAWSCRIIALATYRMLRDKGVYRSTMDGGLVRFGSVIRVAFAAIIEVVRRVDHPVEEDLLE